MIINYQICKNLNNEINLVKDLKVYNQYGSIFWPGHTTIQNINFFQQISINYGQVQVYKSRESTPLLNTQLNKKCKAKLKIFNKSAQQLQNICNKNDLEFLYYKDNLMSFNISHFTKFTFTDSQQDQKQSYLKQIYQSQYIKQRNTKSIYRDHNLSLDQESGLELNRSEIQQQSSYQQQHFNIKEKFYKIQTLYSHAISKYNYKIQYGNKKKNSKFQKIEQKIFQYNQRNIHMNKYKYRYSSDTNIPITHMNLTINGTFIQVQRCKSLKNLSLIKFISQKKPYYFNNVPQQLYFPIVFVNALFQNKTRLNYYQVNQKHMFNLHDHYIFLTSTLRRQILKKIFQVWINTLSVGVYKNYKQFFIYYKLNNLIDKYVHQEDFCTALSLTLIQSQKRNTIQYLNKIDLPVIFCIQKICDGNFIEFDNQQWYNILGLFIWYQNPIQQLKVIITNYFRNYKKPKNKSNLIIKRVFAFLFDLFKLCWITIQFQFHQIINLLGNSINMGSYWINWILKRFQLSQGAYNLTFPQNFIKSKLMAVIDICYQKFTIYINVEKVEIYKKYY